METEQDMKQTLITIFILYYMYEKNNSYLIDVQQSLPLSQYNAGTTPYTSRDYISLLLIASIDTSQ